MIISAAGMKEGATDCKQELLPTAWALLTCPAALQKCGQPEALWSLCGTFWTSHREAVRGWTPCKEGPGPARGSLPSESLSRCCTGPEFQAQPPCCLCTGLSRPIESFPQRHDLSSKGRWAHKGCSEGLATRSEGRGRRGGHTGLILHFCFLPGNDALHQLTASGDYELRVDLRAANESVYATYQHFRVDPPADYYRLHLGSYSGTAGEWEGPELTACRVAALCVEGFNLWQLQQ